MHVDTSHDSFSSFQQWVPNAHKNSWETVRRSEMTVILSYVCYVNTLWNWKVIRSDRIESMLIADPALESRMEFSFFCFLQKFDRLSNVSMKSLLFFFLMSNRSNRILDSFIRYSLRGVERQKLFKWAGNTFNYIWLYSSSYKFTNCEICCRVH